METLIRQARPSDANGILMLLNQVFGDQQKSTIKRNLQFYHWKFLNSIYGKSYLVVAESNNKLIGVANLWPWDLYFNSKIIKALQPCDSAVHPDARGKGIFKKIRANGIQFAKENEYSLLFNFPNTQSIDAYLSLGWTNIGKISWWIKIIDPINIAKGVFNNEKSEPAQIPDDYTLNAKQLDQLATKCRSQESQISIHKMEGFHEYRYMSHPFRKYGAIQYRANGLIGVLIFTINQKGKLREMVIVDYIGSNRIINNCIKKSIRDARHLNIDMIAVMSNSIFDINLMKLGFIKRKNKNMVVMPLNSGLQHIVNDYNNWDMVASLHDSI